MRVGFFLSCYEPASGGAFTFQNSIYQALKTIESRHQFYFFFNQVNGKAIRETVDLLWFVSPNCEIVDDVPYIYTLWDLEHRLQPYFPEVSANGQWANREYTYTVALNRAAFIIVGTETGKKQAVTLYTLSEDRVRVIPFPAPDKHITGDKPADEVKLDLLCLHTPYIFYPAQFWPHKNHIRILQAVKRLREEHGIMLSVVFTGSDQGNASYIQQMASEMHLRDTVFFLGFVAQDVLNCLYRNALALVFPSFFGPDNFPPLEAFSWGCPVIAADIPGTQEQFGNAALLFNPKSDAELADCILRLYQDSELRETLINRGFTRSKQIGGAIAYAHRMVTLLDEFEPIRQCWDM